jgi:hypothetical protein
MEDSPRNPTSVSPDSQVPEFELTVEDCVRELFEATDRLTAEATFENATDVCLASRVAWSIYYSEWRLAGRGPTDLTNSLREALSRGAHAVEAAANAMKSRTDHDYLIEFADSIRFRGVLLDLLLREGADAVEDAAEKRVAQLKLRPRPAPLDR